LIIKKLKVRPRREFDLPPFIVTHTKLELHDHKPLEPEVSVFPEFEELLKAFVRIDHKLS
jgi:hypothetical protein